MSADTAIYYIDDDGDDLDFFNDAMKRLDQEVTLFKTAEKLLKKLRNPPPAPSLLFMDLNMPLRNGFELIADLKADPAFKNLPIIVYSTAIDSATVEKCRLLGASMYINKPTSMPALVRTLRQVLEIDWTQYKVGKNNFLYTT